MRGADNVHLATKKHTTKQEHALMLVKELVALLSAQDQSLEVVLEDLNGLHWDFNPGLVHVESDALTTVVAVGGQADKPRRVPGAARIVLGSKDVNAV